jgi:hypothetical protein
MRWIAIGLAFLLTLVVVSHSLRAEELDRETVDNGLPACQEGDTEETVSIDVCQLRKAVFALKAYPILVDWKDELSNEVSQCTDEYNLLVEDYNEQITTNIALSDHNEKLKTANTVLVAVLVPTALTAVGLGIWALSQAF